MALGTSCWHYVVLGTWFPGISGLPRVRGHIAVNDRARPELEVLLHERVDGSKRVVLSVAVLFPEGAENEVLRACAA